MIQKVRSTKYLLAIILQMLINNDNSKLIKFFLKLFQLFIILSLARSVAKPFSLVEKYEERVIKIIQNDLKKSVCIIFVKNYSTDMLNILYLHVIFYFFLVFRHFNYIMILKKYFHN